MTKRFVTGRDGVRRPAVDPAPSFTPGTPATARQYRSEAQRLEGEARQLMRAEARIAGQVAGYTPATLDLGDVLPWGPARGGLETVEIDDIDYARDAAGHRKVTRTVRKRRGPSGLSVVPRSLRAVAERYIALEEAYASPGGRDFLAAGGGGVSDGGMTTRCALAERRRIALDAIGPSLALPARGAAAHADRGRVSITARAVVDGVCLRGLAIRHILASHGWSRKHAHERTLVEALVAALDRLSHVV